MKAQCCICFKVKTENGWEDIGHKNLIEASYGYCEECFHKLLKYYQQYKINQNVSLQTDKSIFNNQVKGVMECSLEPY